MLTPGTLLGERYVIIKKIGAGGMSIVYKAKDNRLQRYVAIKELREEFVQDEEFVNKFRKEALSAASLSHPNIVGIYDVGSDHEIHYIVMEYVEGKTLKQLIAEEGPFEPRKVLEFGVQIVSALKHAHSKKIIHRDIKPQNILIANDGTLKVTDFGIAKAVDSSTIVATGNAIGSVHYFSPEQAKGKYVNESSDLYSCGIVLFELATKRLPFEADSHISIALKHINEELPRPSSINPNIPKNLENLILKATSKNQVDRYQNADAMLRDMKGILADPQYEVKNNTLAERTILLSAEETEMLRNGGRNSYEQENEGTKEEEPVSIYETDTDNIQDHEEKEEEIPTLYKVLFSVAGVLATLAVVVIISLALFFGVFKSKNYSVPNVVGKTLEEAQTLIENSHLKYTIIQETVTDGEIGIVKDQDPAAGATLKKNGVVKLTVTVSEDEEQTGEEGALTKVPDLKDLDTTAAQKAIVAAGFTIGEVTFEYDDNKPSGTVLDQSPAADEEIASGSKIDLVISKGTKQESGVEVPSVVGEDLDTARGMIISSNLSVGKIKEEYSDDYEQGIVIRQGVSAGTNVEEGTKISLTVSKGKEQRKEEVTPSPEPSQQPSEPASPEPSQQPSEPASPEPEPSPVETTQTQTISLPVGTEIKDSYHVTVKLTLSNGQSTNVLDQNVPLANFPLAVSLTGSGTGVLTVSIDGNTYQDNITF